MNGSESCAMRTEGGIPSGGSGPGMLSQPQGSGKAGTSTGIMPSHAGNGEFESQHIEGPVSTNGHFVGQQHLGEMQDAESAAPFSGSIAPVAIHMGRCSGNPFSSEVDRGTTGTAAQGRLHLDNGGRREESFENGNGAGATEGSRYMPPACMGNAAGLLDPTGQFTTSRSPHAVDASAPMAAPVYPSIPTAPVAVSTPQAHYSGKPATVIGNMSLDRLDVHPRSQCPTMAGDQGIKESISDWEYPQFDGVRESLSAQGLIRDLGPPTYELRERGSGACSVPVGVVPGPVPRHQSAMLGARLAWGPASPPTHQPSAASLRYGMRKRYDDAQPDACQPTSPSSYDSKDSFNIGRDPRGQGRSSGVGSLSSQEVKAINQGYYGYGLQVDWASRPVADRPILDTPRNAKYLHHAGPLHPVESMYPDKVPHIGGGQYRQRGSLQRLGTQVATAGRGFARNFWVIVAFVAVAAGAFGFEGQRRYSAARRHSRRREAYQDYSSSEDDEPAQVDRRGFTAASFMG